MKTSALTRLVGSVGATVIYALIRVFGLRRRATDAPWLAGPLGGATIGERAYEETAAAEKLTLQRHARDGGLIPDFGVLARPGFDPARVHRKIRDFYERTPAFRLDTWATTYFPARIGLWLLVKTISRRVEQLNFPLDGLDTAHGMTSEIVLLRDAAGTLRYTGWFRKLQRSGNVIYTGFYMTEKVPLLDGPCIKVVFPMPNGNATVLLRPDHDEGSGLKLASVGRAFGDVGFDRVQRSGDALRVWRIATLHERFHLTLDADDLVRCEHTVTFLGLRVLTLHYRISPV